MKYPVGDVDGYYVSSGFGKRCLQDSALLIKSDDSQFPPEDHEGFILGRIEMPVGGDIGIRFNCIEQAMADGVISWVKVVIFAPAGCFLGLGGKTVKKLPVKYLHELPFHQGQMVVVRVCHDSHFPPGACFQRLGKLDTAGRQLPTEFIDSLDLQGNARMAPH